MTQADSSITFQLYRANLEGGSLAEVQGPRLAEHAMDSGEVSGLDTVADVKRRSLPAFAGHVAAHERVTFVVSARPMDDESLFYADNYILLPVWIQVVLHDGDWADVAAAIQRVRPASDVRC